MVYFYSEYLSCTPWAPTRHYLTAIITHLSLSINC